MEDAVIEKYVEIFGELPPADTVISYYDEFYINLMKDAINNKRPITPEILDKAIGEQPYDYAR